MSAYDANDVCECFARAFANCRDPGHSGAFAGVEHEYRVLDGDGNAVDFRDLLHRLPVRGRRLDPGDANAYRLDSGLALTADELEAEVVTPPVRVGRGFGSEVVALADEGRRTLETLLPAGMRLDGYSTHINIAVPRGDLDAIARRYALTFGPAFAAIAEREDSLGIYVRPRPGRLELCGDFIEREQLATAARFAVGTVRATAEAVRKGQESRLPPPLAASLLPGRERFGYRLHRHAAFGFDLYEAGPRAVLPLQDGSSTTLGERLEDSWRIARSWMRPANVRSRGGRRVRTVLRAPTSVPRSTSSRSSRRGTSRSFGSADLAARSRPCRGERWNDSSASCALARSTAWSRRSSRPHPRAVCSRATRRRLSRDCTTNWPRTRSTSCLRSTGAARNRRR
ncbi:MAG: hypothetical protein IPG47_10025 [Thermoflexaceae bacterium]|nr:hypothetical protein [Thermoflexaceae bacterium]